jgi:hypothetical protein
MRRTLTALVAGACLVATASIAGADAFDGHRVVRVHVDTPAQLDQLLTLTDDVWSHHVGVGGDIDVRLDPVAYTTLLGLGLQHQVIIDDVGAAIRAERQSIDKAHLLAGFEFYDTYRTSTEIRDYVESLAGLYPDLISFFDAGTSIEGREIWGVRITAPGNPDARPEIAFTGTQHAREWVSPMTVTYIIEQLVTGYGIDADVTNSLDNIEFHIIPIVNPDGYDYSWADPDNRLWRKNRRDNAGACDGVDLNRNWDYEWGGEGSSGNECSETYRGTAPLSEPESADVAAYLATLDNLEAHIDYHSYGEWILYPWSYTNQLPDNVAIYDCVSKDIKQAIYDVHQTTYTDGPGYDTLYPAAGVIPDHVHGNLGAWSWTIELRPLGQGGGGFLLPEEQILPTAEENLPGVIALAKSILAPIKVVNANLAPPPSYLAPNVDQPISIDVYELNDTVETVSLYYKTSDDDDFTATPLTPEGEVTWAGAIPGHDCGETVEYYVQVDTTGGATVTVPDDDTIFIDVLAEDIAFEDDMETDLGWTVGAPGDDAETGIWERADPQETQAQPGNDHTEDGTLCWITGAAAGQGVGGNDIDGGTTTLTSPLFSAGPDDSVSYWRWYSNDQGNAPNSDSMPVSISNDDGDTWTLLELVTENANAWVQATFIIADYVQPTDQMRIRFEASDLGDGSVVEAGVDDFVVYNLGCDCPNGADFNNDGSLSILDFIAYQQAWQNQDPCADINDDGAFNILDFVAFQELFQGG